MRDVAYIMETQNPRELWLIEGENKFKVSRDMYWLLASNGADLPPTHHITELLTENAELRELAARMASALGIDREWCDTSWCDTDCMVEFGCNPALCDGETKCTAWAKLHELGVEVPS